MKTTPHIPVLLRESMAALKPRKGQTAVDCTVGLGGHAAELVRRGVKVIGLDLDPANLERAREKLGTSATLIHANFAALASILAGETAHMVLADLGVSSPHLDDPGRGFSYRKDGPLDMRMDPTRGEPASAVLDRLSEEALAAAIRDLGDEEDAEKVARAIVEGRPFKTTRALAEAVCDARSFSWERAIGAKLHPAARTFQAVRMLVNREIGNLEALLRTLPAVLKAGGRAAVISFHSGEDRLVKRAFRDGLRAGIYDAASDEPILAGEEEREANPRSRSAKLRWVRKA
ncbi:MAG TPA: 16S rRNA (cytosine(1402)-N(4))-methyltransferase RsmH [Planctomycetota bacterium]